MREGRRNGMRRARDSSSAKKAGRIARRQRSAPEPPNIEVMTDDRLFNTTG